MYTFSLQLLAIMATTTVVWSLPMGRGESASGAAPLRTARTVFKVSEEAKAYLTNIGDQNNALVQLRREAKGLTKEFLLTPEYQGWERKVCRGRLFNSKAMEEICKDKSYSALTRTHITEYYNEFVVHLKLAEYNFKEGIEREVIEKYAGIALKKENTIIKILKESILPTLEFILQLGSTDTDCSTTELIASRKISQYTNCTVVQTSNMFLGQAANNLWHKLNSTNVEHFDNSTEYVLQVPDSTKQWCLTL